MKVGGTTNDITCRVSQTHNYYLNTKNKFLNVILRKNNKGKDTTMKKPMKTIVITANGGRVRVSAEIYAQMKYFGNRG